MRRLLSGSFLWVANAVMIKATMMKSSKVKVFFNMGLNRFLK
ncbi:hypothetical protein l13_11330 [Neisseria weaveri ATCC 51223]|nr:hypothetical protein l13_11330 [Neisseria weaveri ATCC 51223]